MTLEQRMEQLAQQLIEWCPKEQHLDGKGWTGECAKAFWDGHATGMNFAFRLAHTNVSTRIKDAIREQNSTHTARMLKMAAAAHDLAKDIPCGIREARTIVEAAVGKLTDKEKAELAAQMEKLDESDERDQT